MGHGLVHHCRRRAVPFALHLPAALDAMEAEGVAADSLGGDPVGGRRRG